MKIWTERIAGLLAWFLVVFGVNGYAVWHAYFKARASGSARLELLGWTTADAWLYLVAIACAIMFNSILQVRRNPKVLLLVCVLNVLIILTAISYYDGITSVKNYCTDLWACQWTGIVCWLVLLGLSIVYLATVEAPTLLNDVVNVDNYRV